MALTLISIAAALLVIRFLAFLLANGWGRKRLRVCECRRFATEGESPDDVCFVCGRNLPQEPVAAHPHFRLGRTRWEIKFTNRAAEVAELQRMWKCTETERPRVPSGNLPRPN